MEIPYMEEKDDNKGPEEYTIWNECDKVSCFLYDLSCIQICHLELDFKYIVFKHEVVMLLYINL